MRFVLHSWAIPISHSRLLPHHSTARSAPRIRKCRIYAIRVSMDELSVDARDKRSKYHPYVGYLSGESNHIERATGRRNTRQKANHASVLSSIIITSTFIGLPRRRVQTPFHSFISMCVLLSWCNGVRNSVGWIFRYVGFLLCNIQSS